MERDGKKENEIFLSLIEILNGTEKKKNTKNGMRLTIAIFLVNYVGWERLENGILNHLFQSCSSRFRLEYLF